MPEYAAEASEIIDLPLKPMDKHRRFSPMDRLGYHQVQRGRKASSRQTGKVQIQDPSR